MRKSSWITYLIVEVNSIPNCNPGTHAVFALAKKNAR